MGGLNNIIVGEGKGCNRFIGEPAKMNCRIMYIMENHVILFYNNILQ